MLADKCLLDRGALQLFVGDAWSTCLFVLLRQDQWSVGVEGEVLDFLQRMYCQAVLGEASTPAQLLSVVPRQTLLGLPHVKAEIVVALEKSLQTEKVCPLLFLEVGG